MYMYMYILHTMVHCGQKYAGLVRQHTEALSEAREMHSFIQVKPALQDSLIHHSPVLPSEQVIPVCSV